MPNRTFLSDDISNFRYFIAVLPILPTVFMGMTFFPAINKGKPAAIIGLARQLVFFVPVMLLLPKFFGVQWVYIGSFGIDVIIALWIMLLINKEFKHLRKDID
jgi:Na+-driven multidrug efflux pump